MSLSPLTLGYTPDYLKKNVLPLYSFEAHSWEVSMGKRTLTSLTFPTRTVLNKTNPFGVSTGLSQEHLIRSGGIL